MSVADSYTQQYEVGKSYRVPCIKTRRALADGWRPFWGGAWIPIIGPLHRDDGAVNFRWLHWHVDLRFVGAKVFKALMCYGRSPFAVPLQKHPVYSGEERITDTFIEGDICSRLMKCKRQYPEFPRQLAKWLQQLEMEHQGVKMKGMVCPHRGLPLQGCPLDGDVVTCPGHGLRWNIKTGELVPSPCATQERP